jgi:hypothetical protein
MNQALHSSFGEAGHRAPFTVNPKEPFFVSSQKDGGSGVAPHPDLLKRHLSFIIREEE